MDRRRIFKDFFIYSAGNYISQGVGMLSSFLLRMFLDPYYMGMWQGLNIITDYTSYTNLGVSRSAAREIPYFIGKEDQSKAEVLKNTGFTFSAIMISFVGIGCMALALIRRPYINNYMFWGLLAIGAIVILERMESYIVTILRAKKKFSSESLVKVFNSLFNLALIVFVVRNFKLFGLYATHIIIFVCSIFLLISLSRERFRLILKKAELKHLIRIGIPLVLSGVMFVNLTNIDRIVILKMLGAKELGLYSIAIMMGNVVYNIANMVSIVLYPQFQERYGKTGDKKQVYTMVRRIIRTLLLPFLILLAGGVLFLPYLLRIFIPKYVDGIKAMKIFLCGIYFLSLAVFYSDFLVTINKQLTSLFICAVTVCLNLGLNIFFVRMGFGIEGVAAATSISYFLYFVLLHTASLAEGR